MKGRIIRNSLAVFALSLFLAMPVMAAEEEQTEETKSVEMIEATDEGEKVTIEEEEVPLGLESQASYEKYKRDVVVLASFVILIVATTVFATEKQKYERKKLN